MLTKHRQSIAPTYNDLLGGQPFDPTNTTQLKYAQAMNLQTNIYTAVLAFGLAQSIMANGAFMLATGIAFVVLVSCFSSWQRNRFKIVKFKSSNLV